MVIDRKSRSGIIKDEKREERMDGKGKVEGGC